MSAHRRLMLRAGLAFFALAEAMVGTWAMLFPRAFYDDFPVSEHDWLAALPPYSEHLIADVGGLNLAVAFMFAVAVVTLHRLLVRTVLVGYLFYTMPHLVFHARHLAGLPTSDTIAQMIVLSVTVGVPLILLALTRRPGGQEQRIVPNVARVGGPRR